MEAGVRRQIGDDSGHGIRIRDIGGDESLRGQLGWGGADIHSHGLMPGGGQLVQDMFSHKPAGSSNQYFHDSHASLMSFSPAWISSPVTE